MGAFHSGTFIIGILDHFRLCPHLNCGWSHKRFWKEIWCHRKKLILEFKINKNAYQFQLITYFIIAELVLCTAKSILVWRDFPNIVFVYQIFAKSLMFANDERFSKVVIFLSNCKSEKLHTFLPSTSLVHYGMIFFRK